MMKHLECTFNNMIYNIGLHALRIVTLMLGRSSKTMTRIGLQFIHPKLNPSISIKTFPYVDSDAK